MFSSWAHTHTQRETIEGSRDEEEEQSLTSCAVVGRSGRRYFTDLGSDFNRLVILQSANSSRSTCNSARLFAVVVVVILVVVMVVVERTVVFIVLFRSTVSRTAWTNWFRSQIKTKKKKKGTRDKPNWLKVADGHTHFIIPRYRVFNF